MNRFIFLCAIGLMISSAAYAQQVQVPQTDTYDQGISLFESGLYEESADELNHFIHTYPDHKLVESAAFYRARARAQTDSSNAKAYYQRFIQKYPNTVFAQKLLLEYATNQKKARHPDEALAFYKQALGLSISNRQSARIYYWMAESEAERQHYEKARTYYLKLADDYPGTDLAPKALYARGRMYLTEKKYEKASGAFELLKKRYPNDKMTRRIGTALGEAYIKQQQYSKAVGALKKSLPYLKGDEKEKAIYLTAESYNALNEFDKASAKYLQYINLTKGTNKERTAHYGLGWVYNKQKIYHWAADEFEKASARRDTLARKALYYKALNEKLGGRYNKSLATFQTFGERYKSGLWFEEAYYEWAITAYETGDYPQAIETLLSLVRSDEKLKWKGKIYTRLGQAYFANKEYTRALQAFNAAEDLTNVDPEVKREARFQKAWVQYRNQAYKPAQKIFEDLHQSSPQTDVGKKALFWDADARYNLQQYGPASRLFRQFARGNPKSKLAGAAIYSLGWSYFKMGQYQKAIAPFQNFLKNYEAPSIALFPYDTDTRLRLADSYYAISDYDQAIKTYQQSVSDDPGGDYALFQIGNSYYRSDRTYQAVRTFRRFLKQFPNSSLREQAQYNIAYVYLNTGNYGQAIKEFQTAISKYPGTAWAARSQYNIGDAHYNAGDYPQAIAAYKKVINQYPNSNYVIEAANGIEYAQQASAGNKPADSASALDSYLKKNGKNSRTADKLRYQQAESLVQSGDYIKAIEKLKQYIRISNNDQLLPEAYINLANSYEQTSHSAKAVEAYQTVLDDYGSSEESAKALVALGRMMHAKGNNEKSFDFYKKLASKNGKAVAGNIGMGDARLAMGQIDEAEQYYEAALDANSNSTAATVGLAGVLISQQRFDEAHQKLKPVAQKNTSENGAQAQYLLGLASQKQGNFNKAIDEYSKVQVLYKSYDAWVAKSLLRSGECFNELGNTSEARKTWHSLVDKFPRRQEAREAQKKLESEN